LILFSSLRNDDVSRAISSFSELYSWASSASNELVSVFVLQDKSSDTSSNVDAIDLSKINDDNVFVPMIPLFENIEKDFKKEKVEKEKYDN
jgi:hypothetical protein